MERESKVPIFASQEQSNYSIPGGHFDQSIGGSSPWIGTGRLCRLFRTQRRVVIDPGYYRQVSMRRRTLTKYFKPIAAEWAEQLHALLFAGLASVLNNSVPAIILRAPQRHPWARMT